MEQGVAKKIKSAVLSGLLLGGVIAVSAVPAEAQVRRYGYSRANDWDRDGLINRYDRDDDNDGIRDSRDRNDRSRVRTRRLPVRTRVRGWRGDIDRDGRINALDRDRDGDGVRDRFDRHPNDRRRR